VRAKLRSRSTPLLDSARYRCVAFGLSRVALQLLVLPLLLSYAASSLVGSDDASSRTEGEDEEIPEVEVTEPNHDWGELWFGESTVHRFRLVHQGKSPLRLDELRPSCGCTFATSKALTKDVAPGDEFFVEVRIESAKLPTDAESSDERIRKSVQVIAPGGRTIATLWMEGFVHRILEFDPPTARISLLRDDLSPAPDPLTVTARIVTDEKVEIRGVRDPKDYLTASLEALPEDRAARLVISASLDRLGSETHASETLLIVARIGDKEVEVPYPVVVVVQRRIDCSPASSCFFPRKTTAAFLADSSRAPVKEIEIVSLSIPTHRFSVKEVEVEEKRVSTRLETLTEGRRYRLIVTLLGKTDGTRGVVKDRIIVRTDDALVPEIVLPVTIQW
jgi:hypothetical protein